MPKCLECGFEAPRLQWTHFKNKCTGRFNNGREYMLAYPGAKVVDNDLARLTAITKSNLISKYGEDEGMRRWEEYRKKQSDTNKFDYKAAKYGWTLEEFDDYNRSRAVTVENLIKKYGMEEGLDRWDSYCEKQRLTKSKEYVISTYGEQAWHDVCQKKRAPHDPATISMIYGITLDQAIEKILSRFQARYTSNLEIEFITKIEKLFGKLDHTSISKPFGKWHKDLDGYVIYDIKHGKCIIEFNGDYWHANPKIYSAQDTIRGKRASDIWEKDAKKLQLVTDLGFNVLVVWERDYKLNQQKTLEDVVKWMQATHE